MCSQLLAHLLVTNNVRGMLRVYLSLSYTALSRRCYYSFFLFGRLLDF